MDDIAKKVGVSKAAVYHYYESKESLVAAIAVSLVESALGSELSEQRNQSLLEAAEGSFGRLLKLMPGLLPNLVCDMISEAHRDGSARRTLRSIESAIVEATSEFWETRKKKGEIAPDLDTTRIARGLVALQLGLLAQISTGFPRQQAIEAWIEIVHRLATSLEIERE
jgi:AcrR family transcriptional regulator